MPDTNPACRTAFRSISESVRHAAGTLSGITPERCPPSVRNPVRHGPERAFFHYVSLQSPQSLRVAQQILAIPQKRFEKPLLGFLSNEEMKAVLAAPDVSRWAGRRDRVMFALLYNTGARVSELLNIRVQDVQLDAQPAYARLHGKGRKQRTIPLWRETAMSVRNWIKEQTLKPDQLLFCNRFGNKMTRQAAADRMTLAVAAATEHCPQLRGRHITCHTVRHATAMHLLQGGVDITVTALWLGHESPVTTHGYIEADLRIKQQALKAVAAPGTQRVLSNRKTPYSDSWKVSEIMYARPQATFATAAQMNGIRGPPRSASQPNSDPDPIPIG